MTLAIAGNSAGGYNLTKSLRFRSSASAYMNRTPASATNRQKWTWSGWVKRGAVGTSESVIFSAFDAGQRCILSFAGDQLYAYWYNGSTYPLDLASTAVYRDPASWYHIVWSLDTTQATASNRSKVYVNGVQVTAFSAPSYPAQNDNLPVNNTVEHNIGRRAGFADRYLDGYYAEVNFIDGQALTPSSFGSTNPTTGVWQPAKYTGSYGTNGYYLPFTNTTSTTTLGYDFSGNGNNWTTNNFSLTSGSTYDSMNDVPTLTSTTVANYCTLNPLNTQSNLTVSAANLQCTNSTANWRSTIGTMGVSSGKYYWEASPTNTTYILIGFAKSSFQGTTDNVYVGQTADSYGYYANGGGVYNNGAATAYGNSYTTGDIIGVALDLDNGKAYFSKNGVWQNSGDPVAQTNPAFTGLSGTFLPGVGMYDVMGVIMNFGQRPLSYTPPTGFSTLNTYNLPNSTILAGNKYMDVTLYTGNAAITNISNSSGTLYPDFLWVKSRSAATDNVLGNTNVGIQNYLNSNNTAAQVNDARVYRSVTNGSFQLGTDAGVAGTNQNGATYAAWQWQAGQGTNTTNTNGSITSTVSVNPTAGFSIVTWTGNATYPSTVGHGLGVAPQFIITKNRSVASSWIVQHNSLGWTQGFLGISTVAATTNSAFSNNTAPTSSVFTVSNYSNNSGEGYVAYCWAPIAGFSAFGSYTGNGSNNGPFIYTGFRPKFILFKDTTNTSAWNIFDASRDPYNVAGQYLQANTSIAEGTSASCDFLSNGFKVRNASNYINTSGDTYIYAAFAENPFKNALAR